MPTLPEEYLTLIMRFAPIFSKRIWHHVQMLVTGEILVRRKRTVTSVLRNVCRLAQHRQRDGRHGHRILYLSADGQARLTRGHVGIVALVLPPEVHAVRNCLSRSRPVPPGTPGSAPKAPAHRCAVNGLLC